MMAWVDAVKKYAEMTGKKFRIYKKGTSEYEAIKKLQRGGEGGLTKAAAKKMAKEEAPKTASGRKVRKDKGTKRMTDLQVARSAVKQGLVSKEEAFGKKMRKQRSDKGVKRGKRAPKVKEEAEEEAVFSYFS